MTKICDIRFLNLVQGIVPYRKHIGGDSRLTWYHKLSQGINVTNCGYMHSNLGPNKITFILAELLECLCVDKVALNCLQPSPLIVCGCPELDHIPSYFVEDKDEEVEHWHRRKQLNPVPVYFHPPKFKTIEDVGMMNVFVKDSPERLMVPSENHGCYVPFPSNFNSPRQRFAIVPHRRYSEIQYMDGANIATFELWLSLKPNRVITLPCYKDAGWGLTFSLVPPANFNQLTENKRWNITKVQLPAGGSSLVETAFGNCVAGMEGDGVICSTWL